MVKDLTDKDLNQDRRIENLEKMFFKNNDFYTGAKAKKTRYAQNLGSDHPNVEGIDAKKTMPKGRVLERSLSKRAINSVENVAFFSYLTKSLHQPGISHVSVFNSAPTNIGGHYNRFSGVFTTPQSGAYIFTWTSFCSPGGYFSLELMVNANAFDGIVCDALGADWYRTASSTAVAHINQGDVIFIRTHHNITTSGDISSYINARTSFAGWFLF